MGGMRNHGRKQLIHGFDLEPELKLTVEKFRQLLEPKSDLGKGGPIRNQSADPWSSGDDYAALLRYGKRKSPFGMVVEKGKVRKEDEVHKIRR